MNRRQLFSLLPALPFIPAALTAPAAPKPVPAIKWNPGYYMSSYGEPWKIEDIQEAHRGLAWGKYLPNYEYEP